MIVVSDTSPITNLAAIGQLDILPKLFGQIHLPLAVVDELSAGGQQWPGAAEVERAEWVIRQQVQDAWVVDALRLDLDRGEAETIALALHCGRTWSCLMNRWAGSLPGTLDSK